MVDDEKLKEIFETGADTIKVFHEFCVLRKALQKKFTPIEIEALFKIGLIYAEKDSQEYLYKKIAKEDN